MARTTPAQKPRGEHSMTSSTGFLADGTGAGSVRFMGPLRFRRDMGKRPCPVKVIDRLQGLHKPAHIAYMIAVFPSSPMTTASTREAGEAQGIIGKFRKNAPEIVPWRLSR